MFVLKKEQRRFVNTYVLLFPYITNLINLMIFDFISHEFVSKVTQDSLQNRMVEYC